MDVRNAIKFMLLSTMAFACMNSIVKYLLHIGTFQIVFFRAIGSLFLAFGFLYKNKISFKGNNKKILILRGVFGLTSLVLFFMSSKYMPIGTAVSIRYLAPIFAAMFAIYLLNERIKPIQWLFFLIAFSGVVVLKGFDTQINSYGLMLAILSAVFSGLVYVVLSKIGKSEHPVVVVFYFMLIATIVGGLLSLGNWVNPIGWDWVLLFSLGIFGYFGQIYMTKAFQLASANFVAPLKYIEVVFTVLLGLFLFSEIYTLWSILGMLLIILGLVLNVLFKSKTKA